MAGAFTTFDLPEERGDVNAVPMRELTWPFGMFGGSTYRPNNAPGLTRGQIDMESPGAEERKGYGLMDSGRRADDLSALIKKHGSMRSYDPGWRGTMRDLAGQYLLGKDPEKMASPEQNRFLTNLDNVVDMTPGLGSAAMLGDAREAAHDGRIGSAAFSAGMAALPFVPIRKAIDAFRRADLRQAFPLTASGLDAAKVKRSAFADRGFRGEHAADPRAFESMLPTIEAKLQNRAASDGVEIVPTGQSVKLQERGPMPKDWQAYSTTPYDIHGNPSFGGRGAGYESGTAAAFELMDARGAKSLADNQKFRDAMMGAIHGKDDLAEANIRAALDRLNKRHDMVENRVPGVRTVESGFQFPVPDYKSDVPGAFAPGPIGFRDRMNEIAKMVGPASMPVGAIEYVHEKRREQK